jgi:serine/threonine protein kinase
VIHRDLKPANIFVSDKGRIVIGDFGISKALKINERTCSVKGTKGYMSPFEFNPDDGGYSFE